MMNENFQWKTDLQGNYHQLRLRHHKNIEPLTNPSCTL